MLPHSQLVRQITMLILLMQMETYMFGAEVLGLMQVRLLGLKDRLDLLELQAQSQDQLVRRVRLALQARLDQLVQLVTLALRLGLLLKHTTTVTTTPLVMQ
jgi:hypothetical protein